jgi:hypothetical protein
VTPSINPGRNTCLGKVDIPPRVFFAALKAREG